MGRVSIANRAKLSWLLLRGASRRLARRLNAHPFFRWPFVPLKADRLLIMEGLNATPQQGGAKLNIMLKLDTFVVEDEAAQ